ncbi:MAG: heme lyase CcmF/NrfE family subunit [Gammaproteobacteria bacterium]|uniref:heme lyase CcmF/NrfE family subunit n=1 Tax=Azohydromonas sp. TaxID=1872666 RepID=UPI002BE244AE|nr:heme lyase CcmF/NrfE family subunit [Azohydromonas sp.]HMM86599.1 heme lyase CcmF/NrfE family subunit [Azohydromonas sp.]
MIPELGHFALILALVVVALAQTALPLVGSWRGHAGWVALARPAAVVQFVLVAFAFGCLTWAFVVDDFSVLLAAQHSSIALPTYYKVTAVWGNHEGSVLLWVLLMSGWTVAVALFSRQLPEVMVARVLAVMGLVSVGFLLFMLVTSNPFWRLLPAAADGNDLNPLLQDPGMIYHPPLLYMGYVGFSVAFAFAIAALISGRLDSTWARWSRPWTTAAWIFLTLGIALGSAWAYYELGWGGWWFWDPVENASFMPWLVGTALIHSLAVTEKRGGFKMWTVLLAILAFSLSLLGTFLVRSGVLSSVHAFATDPERGIFILGFLVAVVGGSLLLFAWRGPKVGVGGMFEPVSREGMLLANNVLLMVATAAVMLGTLYPLVLDAFGLGKISVGPAYFNAVFVPLMAPALFLMGVGPIAKWKKASLPELAVRLRWAAAVSLVAAVVAPFAFGRFTPLVGFGLFLAFWILATSAYTLFQRVQGQPLALWWPRLKTQTGSWYGMLLAHAGVGVFVIGVTLVGGYETEQDLKMEVGSSANAGGYAFKLVGLQAVQGPNYDAVRATFELTRDGRLVKTVYPEKRSYHRSSMPMTEVALERGFTRDLYVSLGEPLDGGKAWAVRIYVKPFVNWIWGGCVLMSLGGLLAVADRRYRLKTRAAQALPRGAAAA